MQFTASFTVLIAATKDEHIMMKWQERNGREDEYYGSWLLEVIDGHRKRQIDDVVQELRDVKCPLNADPEKLKKVQDAKWQGLLVQKLWVGAQYAVRFRILIVENPKPICGWLMLDCWLGIDALQTLFQDVLGKL